MNLDILTGYKKKTKKRISSKTLNWTYLTKLCLLNLQYCLKDKEVVVPPVLLVSYGQQCQRLEAPPGHQGREGALPGLSKAACNRDVWDLRSSAYQAHPPPGQWQHPLWRAQPPHRRDLRGRRKGAPQELQTMLGHLQPSTSVKSVMCLFTFTASRVDFVDKFKRISD